MSQSVENLSLAIIKFTNDVMQSCENCIGLFHTPSSLVEALSDIEQFINQIDHTIVVLPQYVQSLGDGYVELFRVLADNRNSLMCKINERKATDIQMNTMGGILYDEDNLINEISFNTIDDDCLSLANIRIDPIIDPQQYSVLGIVNLFQNEKFVLTELENIVKDEIAKLFELTTSCKNLVLDAKTMIKDGDFINKLLVDDADSYVDLLNRFRLCSKKAETLRNYVKGLFRVYKALIGNYGIYTTAINQYTSFTLECFFNKDLPYEIC